MPTTTDIAARYGEHSAGQTATPTVRTARQLPGAINPANWKDRRFRGDDGELLPDVVAAAKAHTSLAEGLIKLEGMAAHGDPFVTKAQHLRSLQNATHMTLKRAAQPLDSAKRGLASRLADVERDEHAALTPTEHAAEIRRHVANMDDNDRVSLLHHAAESGDPATVAAIISAPAYLSGVTADQQARLKAEYLAANAPELTAARLRLEKAHSLLNGAMDAAIDEADSFIDRDALTQAEQQEAAARSVREFAPAADE